MLTRLSDAAARLDRAAQPRVLDPLCRLARAAAAGVLAVLTVLRRLLHRAVAVPAERAAALVADLLLPPSASAPPRHAARAATPARAVRRTLLRPVREIAVASGLVLLVGVLAVGLQAPPRPAPAVGVPAAAERADRSSTVAPQPQQPGHARPGARPVLPDLSAPSPTPPSTTTPSAAPPHVVPPAPPAPPAPPPAPEPPKRYLPSGTGMWLHDWVRSEGGNAAAVVARARASGFTHLYVQTGSSKKGWIGDEVLGQLLPATSGTGLKVIAWDFPKLIDPEGDARRMAHAAHWQVPGAPRVAAVAPDVETAAEGTRLSPDTVTRYYATLRAALPPDVAILATVPWPSEKRTGFYPYAETAAHSDAFVPMAYWYNRAPEVVTATSMQWLARFGLPVMPVGQGYDGRLDAPYLPEDPDPRGSVQRFVDAARAGGARSVSLWSWQTTGRPQWDVLVHASAGPWPPVP